MNKETKRVIGVLALYSWAIILTVIQYGWWPVVIGLITIMAVRLEDRYFGAA